MSDNISPEEFANFAAAIRHPEFPSLFNDYINEISDPANRSEQIQYLNELEASGEMDPKKILIRPDPWVSARSELVPSDQPVFLNIMTTDLVDDISIDKSGQAKIPIVIAPPRADRDESKLALAFDVLVGTRTAEPRLVPHVFPLAIEIINKSKITRNEKISADFQILKYKYNGPVIPVLIKRDSIRKT